MTDRNEIASLISEDYDVSPQGLLQEYSRQDDKICLSGFNKYCESYDIIVTENEFLSLMQANKEFLFLESVSHRDEQYWSATLHRAPHNSIPEGYQEYNAGQLPDIGDGDELAGVNSPAQDMDMMGQDLQGQDMGAPTGRSTTTDTMSDASAFEDPDGMGELEDPRLAQLWQWLDQPTGPEASYGPGDDLEMDGMEDPMGMGIGGRGMDGMEDPMDMGPESKYDNVEIDDLPDRRYPEEVADEEEQMIAQEEGDGGDRDLDWDDNYRDQPDGNVVRTEPMLTGESQIDEEGDNANLSKIAHTVKGALGKVDTKTIIKWIATKAKENPEIRDQILDAAVSLVKRFIARRNPQEGVIREGKFTCQECGHQYTLPDWVGASSGKEVACPKCDTPSSPDMAAPQATVQPGMMQQPQMQQQPAQPQTQPQGQDQMQGQSLYAQPDMGGGALPDPYSNGYAAEAPQGPAPGMQPPAYPQPRSRPGQLGGRGDY